MRATFSGRWIAVGLCSFQLASCSSDDSNKNRGERDGGDASSGAGGSAGALPRTGGAPGAGGRVGSGGRTGSGGAPGAGGDGAGGVQGAGGSSAGGAPGGGGAPGTGGDGTGGSTDGGPRDASVTDSSDAPDTSACAPCPSGLCLEAGRCAECARDEHCSGAAPRCALDTHTCVACLPDSGDNCPAGEFCDPADLACKAGCKGDLACASGVCGPAHDCARCVSDLECAAGRVCSSGECLAPCSGASDSGASDSGTPDCPSGFVCCGTRCALFSRDFQNCGGCGTSCVPGEYCSATGCQPNTIATICDALGATFLLDGLPLDDAVAPVVRGAFETGCPFGGPISVVSQDATSALNPDTGRPVAGPGELYVTLGGPFGQKLTRYLETSGLTRVYDIFFNGRVWFYGRSGDGGPDPVIVEAGFGTGCEAGISCLSDAHDYFRIESVVDPGSGTRTLQIYGMDAPGTDAAAWFFENRMLPLLLTFDHAYYVYEWIDDDGTLGASAGDTFGLIESGN